MNILVLVGNRYSETVTTFRDKQINVSLFLMKSDPVIFLLEFFSKFIFS